MENKFFLGIFFTIIPSFSHANVYSVQSGNESANQNPTVKILYNAEVTPRQVSELISTLDKINNHHPFFKTIKLYINSPGGSMDSGYLAYQAIKESRIPVETINAGITASSATLIYCGAQKRYTFPEATFILHPAATQNTDKEYISPNDIEMLKKNTESGNKYFKSIYATCTALSNQDIDKILFSNDNARYIDAEGAKKINLSQQIISGITPTQSSYYINNDNK